MVLRKQGAVACRSDSSEWLEGVGVTQAEPDSVPGTVVSSYLFSPWFMQHVQTQLPGRPL